MKRTIIPILLLILCSINLTAQDTIVLDGKKIPKKELSPFNGLGYEVDLSKPENILFKGNHSFEKDKRIISQSIFTSKGWKSFAQVSVYIDADSEYYHLPSSDLKFFDETGNVEWEKIFDGKIPFICYLSSNGKYCIVENRKHTEWDPEEGSTFTNSLMIFDEKGNKTFESIPQVKYCVSHSHDLVCYWENIQIWKDCSCDEISYGIRNYKEDAIDSFTIYRPKEYIFHSFDLKTLKHWSKTFEKEVEGQPVSSNGDYIEVWSKPNHSIYSRDGNEIIQKLGPEFGRGIYSITNDGKYALTYLSSTSDTTYFKIIGLQNRDCFKTNYYVIPEEKENGYHIYNGGQFVNNSNYLVVFNSIIAPGTSAIVFHNLKGDYVGHKVYKGFYNPTSVSLLDDGSFEVYMDGYYLENLTLPGINTKQYLSKSEE